MNGLAKVKDSWLIFSPVSVKRPASSIDKTMTDFLEKI